MIDINRKMVNFLKEPWNIFILLDACRYDAFEKINEKILIKRGTLKKAKTFSSGTKDWIDKNIKGQCCNDIIYIDPIIMMFELWLKNNDFFKIDEVWRYGWDYYYGTILPDQITESTLKQMKNHPDKRIIAHYHQPHPPFLNPAFKEKRKTIVTPQMCLNAIGKKTKNEDHTFLSFAQRQLMRLIGSERAWDMIIKMGLEPCAMGQTYKYFGMNAIVEAYEQNIALALKSVNRIILETNNKIVISSDHSFNYDGTKTKLKSMCVPWMEIN